MTSFTLLPTARRPRELLSQNAQAGLSLEELIAAIIGTGSAQLPLNETCDNLAVLIRSGARSVNELKEVPGIGIAKAAALAAALTLVPTLEREPVLALTAPERVYAACSDLVDRTQEHLVVFYLSIRNHVMNRELVSVGTLTASLIHSREVFRPAILHSSAAILLAHNHPSGDPTPSEADYAVTHQLVRAGRILGIELLDHVVCGRTGFVSIKQEKPAVFR